MTKKNNDHLTLVEDEEQEMDARDSEEEYYSDFKEVTEDDSAKYSAETENPNYVPTQNPVSTDELFEYLMFLTTKKVEDEDHQEQLRHLARRTTTLSDVAVVVRILGQQNEKNILQLIETVQIQEKVLTRLGATDDMFKEVAQEYTEEMEAVKEELSKKQKEASKEKKEDGDGEQKAGNTDGEVQE